MTHPDVSVLMTVRNEAAYLPAALTSLQRQSLDNWQLVVIDDGSSDATPEILASSAQNDPRINVITQPPLGIVTALNTGMPHCRADLIARMDGDDICHPERLARQVRHLHDHPEVDLVTCKIRYFPSPAISEGLRAYESWINSLLTHEEIMRDRFIESPLVQASVLMRKAVVVAAGGYQEKRWSEDYDLWLRMAEHGCRFARLPQTLFFWRDHAARVTRTALNCSLEAFRNCKAHYLQRSLLLNSATVSLWGAGIEGKAWRKALDRIGVSVVRWIEIDPRKVGQTIHGAPVVTPEELTAGSGPILITVGSRGARDEIRQRCRAQQLIEESDFYFVT